MKAIITSLVLLAGIATAQAGTGDKPAKDTNQKRMELTTPAMKAVIEYTGGDTLFVYIENESDEKVQLKLMEGNTTLLNDGLKTLKEQQRVYIISQLPEGEYKIRLKKGNYVVEKTIIKRSPQIPEGQ
jgi:mRNA-degrading endonuclease RelE of RelBE toxin-antitoxin system